MSRLSRLLPALVLPGLLLIAAGCGGADGRVVVKGSLLENGKPFALDQSKLKLPEGATGLPPGANPLRVTFIPAEGGDHASAMVDATKGTFSLPGPDGKGIKPGKYKIAITASLAPGSPDYFGGTFTPERTQIVRDIKAGEEVIIDVTKPQG